ncbi:MAG TPA: hypothetical protein VGH28_12220 [Polyangiaceae bacterium]|jgi:hypothetical protein
MWIELILTPSDCTEFVASITPMSLDLGAPDRVLVIGRPHDIELVPDKGIRLRTESHVVWTVAGLRVPIHARVASLLVAPAIERRNGRDALVLRVRVEKLDVSVLPDFIDVTVLHRINDKLGKHDDALVWRFSEMLDRRFRLPPRVESADAIETHVRWGKLRIAEEGIALAISVDAHAVKVGPPIANAAE